MIKHPQKMSQLRVLLVQLPVPNNPATNVPLASGYLKAYAQAQGLLDRVRIDILPRALADHAGDAMLVAEIVSRRPEVLGISLYTWNSERSLGIAERVKAQLPGLIVVAGGPEVQRDNDWLLCHPAVDLAVIGEGEQTFAELIQLFAEARRARDWKTAGQAESRLCWSAGLLVAIAGLAFRDPAGALVFTADRVALSDLAPLPSPYLLGYLEPGEMLMVEISRWCPYSCGFCLYGRNMGAKLGSRYFPLERILAEVEWGRAGGATQIHFVEANLNLVPVFWPLMRALADLNADRSLALYAELRGEHLTDDVVTALARAGLKVAEVGLQTANPLALQAAHRRTDLVKWAAGTRRLARQGVEIYLDVILGLPADDAHGVAATLDFIEREDLGPYDVFTLQVLPGTETRRERSSYQLDYQDRPPYYVLGTDRLSYTELRRLRCELKLRAGLDPDEVEGCPPPRLDALSTCLEHGGASQWMYEPRRPRDQESGSLTDASLLVPLSPCLERLWLVDADMQSWQAANDSIPRLARHVDLVARWEDAAKVAALLTQAISANPSTLFDCYLLAGAPPLPVELQAWRAALPYAPGYLDRVAVYRRATPAPPHDRVSPRCFLVLPWISAVAPTDFREIAEVIWRFELAEDDSVPLNAWYGAGGSGVCLHFHPNCTASYRSQVIETTTRWQQETGRLVWLTGTV